MSFNQARLQDEQGNGKIRRYVHQPLHIDHFDVHCHIQPNGKIKLTKPVKGSDEYDEIEIPASLVFKLAGLLKATRNVDYVSVVEDSKPEAKQEVAVTTEAEKTAQ